MTLLIRRISELASLPTHPSYVRVLVVFFLLGTSAEGLNASCLTVPYTGQLYVPFKYLWQTIMAALGHLAALDFKTWWSIFLPRLLAADAQRTDA